MSAQTVVEVIDQEIEKLQQARTLLVSSNGNGASHSPSKTKAKHRSEAESDAPVRKPRKLSAAARKKIGEAVKRRWAAQKKAAKAAAKVAG